MDKVQVNKIQNGKSRNKYLLIYSDGDALTFKTKKFSFDKNGTLRCLYCLSKATMCNWEETKVTFKCDNPFCLRTEKVPFESYFQRLRVHFGNSQCKRKESLKNHENRDLEEYLNRQKSSRY